MQTTNNVVKPEREVYWNYESKLIWKERKMTKLENIFMITSIREQNHSMPVEIWLQVNKNNLLFSLLLCFISLLN